MSAEIEAPVNVMPPHEWAKYRRLVLMPGVERERSGDLNAARPNIQVAVTEYAIRELYAKVDALVEELRSVEARLADKRGK